MAPHPTQRVLSTIRPENFFREEVEREVEDRIWNVEKQKKQGVLVPCKSHIHIEPVGFCVTEIGLSRMSQGVFDNGSWIYTLSIALKKSINSVEEIHHRQERQQIQIQLPD